MDKTLIPLKFDGYYHIYNRGINGCTMFDNENHFEYFIFLYNKYIQPIAETFAWCLIYNHFHFLVRIKTVDEIEKNITNETRFNSQQFSNFFNAYTKYFNKHSKRHGTLFERPFKRKQIMDNNYLMKLIIYIHTNPVHHGIVENPINYNWSSYQSILESSRISLINNFDVIKYFDDIENFIFVHQLRIDSLDLEF